MKKIGIFFILLLYGVIQIYAQDDHLEPECGVYGYDHYSSIVCKPFGTDFEIRFVAAPSWGHLASFSMEKENKKIILKINTVSYAGRDERSPGFCRFEISSSYEDALKSLFSEALSQVDFTKEDSNGLDGETYYFVQPGHNENIKVGRKWSPKDSTLMYRLTALCDTISMATSIFDLPKVVKLYDLTKELKEYNVRHQFKSTRYKSFAMFDLTDKYYEGRVDKKPYYPTTDGMTHYAIWQIQYPDSLLKTDTWGWTVCQLVIDSLGHVSAENYLASHSLFEKEAKRIVHSMTKWIPAVKDRKNVKSDVIFFIPFNPEFYRKRKEYQTPVLTSCKGQKVDKEPEFSDNIRSLVMGNRHWVYGFLPDTVVVTCRFTVNRDGYIENAHVVNGLYPTYNNAALNIIYGFPRIIPALRKGKHVPFDYLLTIRFWREDYSFYRNYRANLRRELQGCMVETESRSMYKGGFQAIRNFIKSNLTITDQMKKTGKQGRVICSFIVDFDRSLRNFRVVHSLHPLLDREALRVLKQLPNEWSNGYIVNSEKNYLEFCSTEYNIPVSFEW